MLSNTCVMTDPMTARASLTRPITCMCMLRARGEKRLGLREAEGFGGKGRNGQSKGRRATALRARKKPVDELLGEGSL